MTKEQERAEMIKFMDRLFYDQIHNGIVDCNVTLKQSQFDDIIRLWPDIYFHGEMIEKLGFIKRLLKIKPKTVTLQVDQKWLEETRNNWLFTQTFLLHGYLMHVEVTYA